MKFPKNLGSEWSGIGRTKARLLDTEDTQWLRARRFGAEARNKGGYLTVKKGTEAFDGFYSIGAFGSEARVVGSNTARGTFTDRGTFVQDDGLGGVDQIRYYGRGLGYDTTASFIGTSNPDFDGKGLSIYDVVLYRTRDGTRFVPHFDFFAVAPFGFGTRITHVPGEVYGPAGARKFQLILGYTSLRLDGQHYHAIVRDDGTTQELLATPFIPDQIAADSVPMRVSPGRYCLMGTYLRPTYGTTSIDIPACPGITFAFSDDACETWSPASSTALFQEFFDTVVPLDPAFSSAFNDAVLYASLQLAPLSATRALAYALVPYAPGTPFPYTLKGKVKLGIVDTASRTLLSTVTLLDDELNVCDAFLSGGCVGVKGGAVIHTRPKGTVYTNIQNDKPVVLFTPNGVDIATMPPMPQPNFKTGLITAISPTQLVCPMYDGAHSLYESKDNGSTWARRALLKAGAAAPVATTGIFGLEDFAVLTFLRNNDNPANATPGTPWASDIRIEAPVL